MGCSELDLAGPVAAGPVHEGVHLCTGKAGQQDGLPVQRAMPRQKRLSHTHDVRAMLCLWQLIQGLEHCNARYLGWKGAHDYGTLTSRFTVGMA